MSLENSLRSLGDRIVLLKDRVSTEEATKTSFILPFLQILGYDIFNPLEVVPEYDAIRGIKKGEKVDYCILLDNKPAIIIECKNWSEKLQSHDSQLFRYFHVTESRIAILTNGIIYKFYTDLVESNKMDTDPFFEFDITDLKDEQIAELSKFGRSVFNIEEILSNAEALKLGQDIKNFFHSQLTSPSEAFVKFFVAGVYNGKVNAKVLERFSRLVPSSIIGYIQDSIRKSLKNAINQGIDLLPTAGSSIENEKAQSEVEVKSTIETTAEELEAFFVIKSILRTSVPPSRIFYRDAQSYFSVLVDDNNRKPVCRLYFNGKKKQIGIFATGDTKVETKHNLEHLDQIFDFAPALIESAKTYI